MIVRNFVYRGTVWDTAEFFDDVVVLRRKTRTGQEIVGRRHYPWAVRNVPERVKKYCTKESC